MIEDFKKLMDNICGLERCLLKEGVSENEINYTRKQYIEKTEKPMGQALDNYKQYLETRYETLKRYWDNGSTN